MISSKVSCNIISNNAPVSELSSTFSFESYGFTVEDLDDTIKMLREKNIELIRGPIQTPSGEKFVFIKDPDGVEIELIQGFNM